MAEIFDPKPAEEKGFVIEERILKAAARAEEASESAFREIDRIARFNGEKVLKAFINNKVSDACLKGSSMRYLQRQSAQRMRLCATASHRALTPLQQHSSEFCALATRWYPLRADPMIPLKRS